MMTGKLVYQQTLQQHLLVLRRHPDFIRLSGTAIRTSSQRLDFLSVQIGTARSAVVFNHPVLFSGCGGSTDSYADPRSLDWILSHFFSFAAFLAALLAAFTALRPFAVIQ